MDNNRLAIGTFLVFALSGVSLAAVPLGQGVIQFHGSIEESGCITNVKMSSTFEFKRCPSPQLGSAVSVRRVESVSSVSATGHSNVKVKLLAGSSPDGRYYNQQYELVEGSGKPVLSGAYVITLTLP
ncbi:type 1 fimbrial protein [Pseudomonas kulmbachensis]|uniref:type 1 fimbrial protein n=1 Tax=Pseudomonas kulmbachensis TaxID=3043408 RepID=UPI002AB05923|nr:type 1 fimbrial protein [Pseudomonas sp. FLM 004-28]